ncbi:MAG: SAM-dependent chlorinase/fluorinase [Thermomicrobiaceae bacterium]
MHRNNPAVTFLTDFGLQDTFVGQMKGVALSHCPDAALVDLTHGVSPQSITEGAYHLAAAWHWFPEGTIHVCVVDPGVGTARRAIAVNVAGHLFLAPDNSLLSCVLRSQDVGAAVDLTPDGGEGTYVSRTFHGRDVFARAAGRLAQGAALSDLGPAIDPNDLKRFEPPEPRFETDQITGEIIMVDHWGNAITNISADQLGGPDANWSVKCGDLTIAELSSTYAAVERGNPVAVISSMDTVEIAVRDGAAASRYDLRSGMKVDLKKQL